MKKYWLPFFVFSILTIFFILLNDWTFLIVALKKLFLLSTVAIYATLLRKVIFWYLDFSCEYFDNKRFLPVAIFMGLWYLGIFIAFALMF